MKGKHIVTRTKNKLRKGKTDWQALKRLTDEDIDRAIAEDADAAPGDLDWSKAELVIPPKKKAISIRLDEDVVEYFRAGGRGYQTRINAILRYYMEHRRKKA